ncbi:extracellular solute-binding protein [Paenibacillus sp. UNC496MF]|nr:extracellular solute-binding protein [Paenibacillus sp. UNC496MF]
MQNSDIVSGKTNIKEVHKLWGASWLNLGNGYERDALSMGGGTYDFGIGSKTGIVYDLRYYYPLPDPDRGLTQFTFNAVIAALGMPKAVTCNGNDKIYTYTAGRHQLKFVGSKTAPNGKSSSIAHINLDDYVPNVVEALRDPDDRRLYALASSFNAGGLFVNKSLFAAAGAAAPTEASTWPDVMALAKRVRAAAGTGGFSACPSTAGMPIRSRTPGFTRCCCS